MEALEEWEKRSEPQSTGTPAFTTFKLPQEDELPQED